VVSYAPYGELHWTSGSDPGNHYLFTGKERDTETGLDYFGARYYDSAMGRFLTPDWADKPTAVPYANYGNPQSLNLYAYVQNKPTTVEDPDGHNGGDVVGQAKGDLGMAESSSDPLPPTQMFFELATFDGSPGNHKPSGDDQIEQNKMQAQLRAAQEQQTTQTNGQALTTKLVKHAPRNTMEIVWKLSKKSRNGGYIVQEVTTTDSAGRQTYHYWEAWKVPKGSNRTDSRKRGFDYDDMFSDPSGTTVHASARFYEGLLLPSSFVPNNTDPRTDAGLLPSTADDPHLPTDNATAPVDRTWTAP